MKSILLVLIAVTLTCNGCSSTSAKINPQISGYNGLRQITQDDVIMKTQNCKEANMRPVVQYVQQEFNGQTVEVAVAVNCYPYYR